MKLIVGLGNPGHTYHGTRHNVGFAVIERLADRHGVSIRSQLLGRRDSRPAAVCGDYTLHDMSVRLLMPLTMMNESGDALRDLQAAPEDLLIVCDDVNLPLGSLRLRAEGSAGGHHGLQSCLAALGTEQVPRLRVGIGTEPLPSDLRDFVLSPFGRAERPLISQAIDVAVESCDVWITEGIEVAMNRSNTNVQPT